MEACSMEKLKILVVDDESRMRKLVRDFLVKQNFDVLEAGDGEEAVDIFFKEKDIDDAEDGWLAGLQRDPEILQSTDYHADGQRRRAGRTPGL